MKNSSTLRQLMALFVILLVVPLIPLKAHNSNDVGVTEVSSTTSSSKLVGPSAQMSILSGDDRPCPSGFEEVRITGQNIQSGSLFRNLLPSTCAGKDYPGPTNPFFPEDEYYELICYPNAATSSTCITVDFDPTTGPIPCSDNSTFFDAHIAAYGGSYNPNDFSENYLGDIGSSITGSFSFELPAGETLVLVAFNNEGTTACDFSLRVNNLVCEDPILPEPLPLMSKWSLLLITITMLGLSIVLVGRIK